MSSEFDGEKRPGKCPSRGITRCSTVYVCTQAFSSFILSRNVHYSLHCSLILLLVAATDGSQLSMLTETRS